MLIKFSRSVEKTRIRYVVFDAIIKPFDRLPRYDHKAVCPLTAKRRNRIYGIIIT